MAVNHKRIRRLMRRKTTHHHPSPVVVHRIMEAMDTMSRTGANFHHGRTGGERGWCES